MTCWSSRSRSNRNKPSVPLTSGHSAAAVFVRTPPLIAETAENGKTRVPDLVFTMSDEIRERSSCGASVTSRTRPLTAPEGSYTVAPNSSVRASVVIPLENNQLARDSERKSKGEPLTFDPYPAYSTEMKEQPYFSITGGVKRIFAPPVQHKMFLPR